MFNRACIDLIDRSFLHMSLNQVELALKDTTSKSRKPVFIYFPRTDFSLFFFSIMERIIKGSDLPKLKK